MRSAVPWILLAAAALFHLLAWGSWVGFHTSISWNGEPLGDFTAVYYPMGLGVLEGAREPVQGFYYSPFAALLCAPFAALPPQVAAWTWLGLLVVALLLVVLLPLRWARTLGQRDLYLATALFAFPFLHDLHWGQVSTLMAACLIGALVLHERGSKVAAGALIGFAGAIKFYPALFLGALALRREWRGFCTGLGVLVLLAVLVPTLTWSPSDVFDFYASVVGALDQARRQLWSEANAVQYVPAVLGRWITGDSPGAPAPGWVVLGVLAFLFCMARRMRQHAVGEGLLEDFAVLWLALPLVLYPSWPHYFVGLPFAGLIVMRRGGAMVLVGASGFLASILLFRFVGDSVLYARLGILALADLVLLMALLREARGQARPDSRLTA